MHTIYRSGRSSGVLKWFYNRTSDVTQKLFVELYRDDYNARNDRKRDYANQNSSLLEDRE